jgi:hypothetical protein
MRTNTVFCDDEDFDEPAINDPNHYEDIAAELIPVLQQMFERRVSNRRQLNDATDMFYVLEGLRINRASEAWGEVLRLKRIWKYRLSAQDDIDRWMIEHGHPLY